MLERAEHKPDKLPLDLVLNFIEAQRGELEDRLQFQEFIHDNLWSIIQHIVGVSQFNSRLTKCTIKLVLIDY